MGVLKSLKNLFMYKEPYYTFKFYDHTQLFDVIRNDGWFHTKFIGSAFTTEESIKIIDKDKNK